jgi:hypothetical protein
MALNKLAKFKDLAPKEKTTKSTVEPIVDAQIDEVCDRLVRSSKELKNAEAAHEQAQAEVIDYMMPIHLERLQKGSLNKSFRLNDKVLCLFTDRFKNLSQDDRQEVESRLEKANIPVDKLFTEKLSLKLKKDIEENYEMLNKLMSLLGEDVLKEYFDLDIKFTPVDDFYKALVKENAVSCLEDIISQIRYKPTVKVG